jgi:hypothetical protein
LIIVVAKTQMASTYSIHRPPRLEFTTKAAPKMNPIVGLPITVTEDRAMAAPRFEGAQMSSRAAGPLLMRGCIMSDSFRPLYKVFNITFIRLKKAKTSTRVIET